MTTQTFEIKAINDQELDAINGGVLLGLPAINRSKSSRPTAVSSSQAEGAELMALYTVIA